MKSLDTDPVAAEVRRLESMEAVIDTYQTPLLRYAAHLLNNATLAQDALQNALVKLFRQWQAGITGPTHLILPQKPPVCGFTRMPHPWIHGRHTGETADL